MLRKSVLAIVVTLIFLYLGVPFLGALLAFNVVMILGSVGELLFIENSVNSMKNSRDNAVTVIPFVFEEIESIKKDMNAPEVANTPDSATTPQLTQEQEKDSVIIQAQKSEREKREAGNLLKYLKFEKHEVKAKKLETNVQRM